MFVQLWRVLKVHFEDVTTVVVKDIVVLDDVFQAMFHLTALLITQPCEIIVGHRLRHCPAVLVVCIHLHDERSRFGRIV